MIEVIIGQGLRDLEGAIHPEYVNAVEQIAEKAQERWQRNILKIKGGPRNKIAWLTGAYYYGVELGALIMHGNETTKDVFDVMSYADIIEKGIKGTTYTARPIAKITTEELEPVVDKELGKAGKIVTRKF